MIVADPRRPARLNRLLREEISRMIRVELKDPRVQTVTVTAVRTSSDLSHATVYIRTLGDEVDSEEALAGLQSATPFLRRALGRELRLRRIPEIHFLVDHTLEHALRIEELLRMAKADEGNGSVDE